MKIQFANNFAQNLGMGDPTTFVYKFIYYQKENNDIHITQCLLCMDWYYASR